MIDTHGLEEIAKTVRYVILKTTTAAGSGHPTSSLSAADLMCGLMFGGAFQYDVNQPDHPNNDRLIFSKGHASPLLYALWVAAGKVTEQEAMTLRQFDSPFEGHPTYTFRYAEAATGSLGQGLSIGVGMALNAKYIDRLPYTTYVLLGDSEMTEGSQWEAVQLARHYRLDNLVGVLDVNRLGQRGETIYGHDLEAYQRRLEAFGWQTRVIDLYSIKPLDVETLSTAAEETGRIITVEDHYPAGGIGEAVCAALSEDPVPVYCLAVDKMPKSGPPDKLLEFEQISKGAIVDKVKEVIGEKPRSRAPEPDICTKAPEWAEHERLSDADMPCDDGRSGRL